MCTAQLDMHYMNGFSGLVGISDGLRAWFLDAQ